MSEGEIKDLLSFPFAKLEEFDLPLWGLSA